MTNPMLVKSVSGWYAVSEDGQKFDLVPAGQIGDAVKEACSWRSVAERLETEMQELLHACDCEIRDQTNNRQHSDRQSAAYAEGALRVAKGIAHRIREKSAARA